MTARLEARSVSRAFGGLQVTRDVSFDLGAGDRVALIGPNGAGKTTLVNLISGGIPPSSGHFFMDGADITRLSVPARRMPDRRDAATRTATGPHPGRGGTRPWASIRTISCRI